MKVQLIVSIDHLAKEAGKKQAAKLNISLSAYIEKILTEKKK